MGKKCKKGVVDMTKNQLVDLVERYKADDNYKKVTIVFDNGGGVTLQIGDEFAHHYLYPEQAANDFEDYLNNASTTSWEGHEPDALELDPDDNDIRNGGYRVYDPCDLVDLYGKDDDELWDGNVAKFMAELKKEA